MWPNRLSRREFLRRSCQGTSLAFIPAGFGSPLIHVPYSQADSPCTEFYVHPHYRTSRTLDEVLKKVQAGFDDFVGEKYQDKVAAILSEWSAEALKSPSATKQIEKILPAGFSGTSPKPTGTRKVREDASLDVFQLTFARNATLRREAFLGELRSTRNIFSKLLTAEFQVTRIQLNDASQVAGSTPTSLETRVRFELVGTGNGFHREQRVGYWQLDWDVLPSGDLQLKKWTMVDETRSRSLAPIFTDIAAQTLGANSSYREQFIPGIDYWRTVLDGACGIDIYGHNGVSVGDIDGDGFDDLYVCQPAGLPNRLYRNRGDGTFEDITEASGVGLLDNTACALFADFDNDGRQDLVVVRATGPLLFLNQGNGKFRPKPDAFQFANPPQGTFTGAAAADYDRDGWLDIYFCLYVYYQGTDQYRYPVPYYDAENGPPNFMMRNNRDGTFRDVTAANRSRPQQHALQFLLRLGRLQRRRLARSLRGQRFRPQEPLPQQWRRHVHRRRRRSWRRRRRRRHERLLARLRQRRRSRISTSPICGPRPANASRMQADFQKDAARKRPRALSKTRHGQLAVSQSRRRHISRTRVRARESAWAAGRGPAMPGISITMAFPISTSRTAWSPARRATT